MLDALDQGAGGTQRTWPATATAEELRCWFDEQIASSRTPYGFHPARLLIVRPGVTILDTVVGTRAPWPALRRQLASQLPATLAQSEVATCAICFGTTLHAALRRQSR